MRRVSSVLGVRFVPVPFGQLVDFLGPRSLAVPSSNLSTTDSGAAGRPGSDGAEHLRDLSKDEVRRVGERTNDMWKEHVALKTSFPEASLPPGSGLEAVTSDAVRRKRLVYRSKQRGWLEVDLLLGTWAEQNVPFLTTGEMDSYEDILNLETLDIFHFITGNGKPPAFVDTPMMARLQDYVKSNPLGQSPESYAMAKRTNNLT